MSRPPLEKFQPQVKMSEWKLFINDGNINPELCDKLAKEQVDSFLADKDNRGYIRKITKTQVRRFFSDLKDMYNRYRSGEPYGRLFPLIKLVKSKAQYAHSRGKITAKFKDFIIKLIDNITDKENTFEPVILHFEAVVGFMYGEERNLMQ